VVPPLSTVGAVVVLDRVAAVSAWRVTDHYTTLHFAFVMAWQHSHVSANGADRLGRAAAAWLTRLFVRRVTDRLHHRSLNRRGTAKPCCRRASAVIAGHVAGSRHQERMLA
jgi:hypothetical protein